MSNLISRDEAIAKIEKAMCEDGFRDMSGLVHKTTVYAILRSLSEVKPEIIHCIDCRYACIEKDRESDEVYCSEMDFYPSDDFYCGYAKKREGAITNGA